ncbi:hypothetical protein L4D06_14775 [Enterovibrio makurazakiensis]|uniref:hypothetical protein n=1 Tax=Enterovibrio makurazakiensis TaxID=2910232 RepID=UPI003D219E76
MTIRFSLKQTPYISACFFSLLLTNGTSAADNVTRYNAVFKSTSAYCFSYVNGLSVLDNLMTSSGTASAGYDITAILENGLNTLSIKVASVTAPQNLDFVSDAKCEFSVVPYGTKDEQDSIPVLATVNDNNRATGLNTPHYSGTKLLGTVEEGTVEGSVLYEVKRTFVAAGLPNWSWTTSEPYTLSQNNLQKLRDRYLALWALLSQKDADALGAESEIAMREHGLSIGYSADEYWQSFGFKQDFADGYEALPIDWSLYDFVSYKNGRLFRLEDPDGQSPLRIGKKEEESYITYNPLFSYIDGKLVITR